jgi:NSS family neurotransmitter:Na+ symporter
VDWENLNNAKLWLEALTQNAWDTGAGWGLVLCYAVYLRKKEDTALNAIVLPVANNVVSLMAGIIVICTVFAVVPELVGNLENDPQALAAYPELAQAVAEGQELSADLVQQTIFSQNNEGLTFIWMPQLFGTLPFGQVLMILFFLALSFAAFTSMVAMVESPTRALVDAGLTRKRAITIVGSVVFLCGLPSVLSMSFLKNQDWVWGVGLMLCGLFFAISVIPGGVRRFREEQLNHEDSDIRIGRWWDLVIGVLVPIQAVVLLVWLLYESWTADPDGWLAPFAEYNVGTVLLQFVLVLSVLILMNRWIVRRTGDGA